MLSNYLSWESENWGHYSHSTAATLQIQWTNTLVLVHIYSAFTWRGFFLQSLLVKRLGGVRGEITMQESKNIHLWVITYLNRPVLRAECYGNVYFNPIKKKKKVWRSEHFCTDCHYFVNTHWKSHESGTAPLQTTLEESLFSGRELCTDNYTVLFWQSTLWFPSWHIISCSKSHTH